MNPSALLNSGIRFVLLVLLQAFLLKQISWGWSQKEFLFVFLYPLFLLLLPLRMPRPLVIVLGFLLGLSIDFFYDTLGLHAAAATFSAYFRPIVLQLVQPKEKYNIKANPTPADLGWSWFSRYAAWLLLFHLVFFFGVEAFTLVYWADILLKTMFTFAASYFAIMISVVAFNPRS